METIIKTSVTIKELKDLYMKSKVSVEGHTATVNYDEEDYFLSISVDVPNDYQTIELWKGEEEVELEDVEFNFLVKRVIREINHENGEYSSFSREDLLEDRFNERRLTA